MEASLPKTENAVRNETKRTKPKLRLSKTNRRVTSVIYTDAFLKWKASVIFYQSLFEIEVTAPVLYFECLYDVGPNRRAWYSLI